MAAAAGTEWWVVQNNGSDTTTQSAATPQNAIAGPFANQGDAAAWMLSHPGSGSSSGGSGSGGSGGGSKTWWVVVPQIDQGKTVSQKEHTDLRASYPLGSAGDKAMRARKPYSDPNFGQVVVYWKGPFATEAEAKTAQNPQQFSPNPLKDPGQSGTNIGDFLSMLTEGNVWLRVGEFVIGGIIIYVGLKAMFPSEVTAATAPIRKAAKIAPIAAA
jgi:hypothetical protein